MKQVYGLTGGIACGKTTVAEMLEARGATVIDADAIAREVVEPGTPGLDAVVQRFGDVLREDGTLNREALGAIVFSDADARADLNAILHPLIAQRSAVRIGEALMGDGDPVFYDAALLVENGTHRNFAGLVVVTADTETQIARLARRDGLDRDQALARIRSQMPLDEKAAAANHVIDNSGSLADLEARVNDVLAVIRSEGA